MKRCVYGLVLVALLLLSGCAAQNVGPKQRYFWPIGGQEPKIEYIKFYESDRDVKPPESPLAQAVLGVEEAKTIFVAPHGIGSRGDGVFAVTDPGQRKVVVVDSNQGKIRALQDLEGADYFFPSPMAVVYRPDGGGYVCDSQKNAIYSFNAAEKVVQEIGTNAELNRPNGLAYDARHQRLYVADTSNHQIAVFSAAGELLRRIGKRGGAGGEFNFPLDVALAPTGDLVVLDALNARVQLLRPDGTFVRKFGERGTAAGSFSMPKALAVDGFGQVYITDGRAHRFEIFDLQGHFLLNVGAYSLVQNGQIQPGGLAFPKGVTADKNGKILIVDSLNRMVHQFQFLSEDYLRTHPIRKEEIVLPGGVQIVQ